jgi:hypothetical protein
MSLIWVPEFLTEELHVLEAFFNKQEFQIAEFTKNIEMHVEVYQVERWQAICAEDESEPYIDEIEHISGITEDSYDIRGLFLETMPIYQRQAFLLTLWGVFESELEKMCISVCSTFDNAYSIPPKPKNISHLQHFLGELEKRGVPSNPSTEYLMSLDILSNEVRHVRNAWAHNAGRDKDNKIPENADGIVTKDPIVTIAPAYIHKVIFLMSVVAKELNAYSYPLLLSAIKRRSD